MAERPIHWHEGMFLRPHHFQAADRHAAPSLGQHIRWDVHHDWGLRPIEIDPDALGSFRFVVRPLEARLRDGTLVSACPTTARARARPQARLPAASRGRRLPRPSRSGGPASRTPGPDVPTPRYLVDNLALEDENTGVNPQPVSVRRLEPPAAARPRGPRRATRSCRWPGSRRPTGPRRRRDSTDATSRPLLACDAWPVLPDGILQTGLLPARTRRSRCWPRRSSRAASRSTAIRPGDGRLHAPARPAQRGVRPPGQPGVRPGRPPAPRLPGAVPARRPAGDLRRDRPAAGAAAVRPRRPGRLLLEGEAVPRRPARATSTSRPTRSGRSSAPGCGCRWRWSRRGWSRRGRCSSACRARCRPRSASGC